MGYFADYDPANGKQTITPTFTCPHHNTVHPMRDEHGRRLDVMMCRKCMKPVCDACVMTEASGGNMCVPAEKRMDAYEKAFRQAVDQQLARHHLLKKYGL